MDLDLAPEDRAFRDELRAWLAKHLPRRRIGRRSPGEAHGGIGFTWENDMHLLLERALANAFGDADHHRDRVAELAF